MAPPNCAIFLCANKVDLPPESWRVRKEEYETYAAQMGFPIYECSASSGLNVQNIFTDLGAEILKSSKDSLTKVENDPNGQSGNSLILAEFAERQRREKKKGSCCK